MISRHALLIVVFAVLNSLAADVAVAQATNPPYLAAFPSVERVKQSMKVSDPRETAIRQIGALWQLEQIIRQLSGSREFRGFLPDEARIIGEYQVASYYIAQAVDKAYPGNYMQAATVSAYTPYRFSRTDGRFGIDGIEVFKAFLTPAIQNQFAQTVGGDVARANARRKADQEAIASIGTNGQPKSKLAEEQAGIRRCAESGRSETECMMEGLGKSAMGMVEGVLPGLAALKGESMRGLRMSGSYPGTNGFYVRFYSEQVAVGCADLAPAFYPYEVLVNGPQVSVTVNLLPKPLVLSFRQDGRLAGPDAIDIAGQVQVGVQTGVRTYSDGRTEQLARPVFEDRTRRCSVGTLATGTSVDGALGGSASALVGTLLGVDKNQNLNTPPGLRMTGEYGSQSAFDLEFRPEGVVVGCREVATIRPYTVTVRTNGVSIDVQHGSTPFTVYFGNGRLAGSGTVKVDGRQATGTDGSGQLTYVPRSASCVLGTLTPASASH